MDPFQFIEKDGFFYGRGTGDDKAQAAVWIANLIRYKREGFKPDRDIIVALTADEEGGGPYNGVDWLIKNHRELIDAEFASTKAAGAKKPAARKSRMTCRSAKNTLSEVRFEVRNKGGHSSMPVPDNAIYHLAAALDRLAKFGFPAEDQRSHRRVLQTNGDDRNGPVRTDDLEKAAEGDQAAMQRVAASRPRRGTPLCAPPASLRSWKGATPATLFRNWPRRA